MRYDEIDGDGLLEGKIVIFDGPGSYGNDLRWSLAARLVFVLCTNGMVLCILPFVGNLRRSIKI